MFPITPLLLLLLILLAYYYFSYKFTYWKRKGVQSFPVTIPSGNILQILVCRKSYTSVFTEIYKKINGAYAGIYFGLFPVLFVKDPEIIKDVLIKKFDHFQNRGVHFDEKHEPLSAHLFRIEGEKWKTMRRKLTPAFSSGKLKWMTDIIFDCGNNLRSLLNDVCDGDNINFSIICHKYATDVIASVGFGYEANSLKDDQSVFYHFASDIKSLNPLKKFVQQCVLFVPELLRLIPMRQQSKESEVFFLKTIDETVKYREENNKTRNDFMQLLINMKNQENEITMRELAAQAYVFYIAGLETSNHTLSYTLYYLAKYPEIQAKLLEEIDATFDTDEKFTYENINGMMYLEMVLLESLRLRPTLSMLNRVCNKPYTIPNTSVTIDVGTKILISIIDLQTDPKYFPNPDKFDPERFSPANKSKIPSYCYMPFGEGPRKCIGERQGKFQTKIGLISILRDHSVHICSYTKEPSEWLPGALLTVPKDPIILKLVKRKKSV
ncbi:cytochrome P450 6k1-like [Chrysoperla carnea]|uniref:cytochrome P450 6k1-like n=1 Tax=Chrysoperla carnea TaxID=189513 RepID=UPI001D0953FC|nr:cytochrome P450 6k1-like [Chrysoperla carnea]